MGKSAYNYTIVEEYKQKLVIPYTGLEFEGWLMIVAFGLSVVTGTALLGLFLSAAFGSNGYFLAVIPSVLIPYVVVKMSEVREDESGRTKFEKFYYKNIKKYSIVYDSHGVEHIIRKKRKGVIFVVR